MYHVRLRFYHYRTSTGERELTSFSFVISREISYDSDKADARYATSLSADGDVETEQSQELVIQLDRYRIRDRRGRFQYSRQR